LLAVCYRVSRTTREAPVPLGVDAPLIVVGDEDLDYVAFLSDPDDVEDLHELSDVYDDVSELEEVVLPDGIVLPASLYD
jgi:hypothetical protein